MVEGVVNARLEAVVSLTLMASSGQTHEIEAVIDTGFSEHLVLPTDLVEELGLEFLYSDSMLLADGGMTEFRVFDVTAIWDGRAREVRAIASNGMALVGMGMLEGHRLAVDVVEGGKVLIESRG